MTITPDLLKHIKALAEGGSTEGERSAARAKLEELMAKSGITLDQLKDEKQTIHFAKTRIHSAGEQVIAIQLLCMIQEAHSCKLSVRKKRMVYFATDLQALQFEMLLEHYLKSFRKQQEEFASMFIARNSLYSEATEEEHPPITKEELERLLRIMEGAKGLSPTPSPRPRLKA